MRTIRNRRCVNHSNTVVICRWYDMLQRWNQPLRVAHMKIWIRMFQLSASWKPRKTGSLHSKVVSLATWNKTSQSLLSSLHTRVGSGTPPEFRSSQKKVPNSRLENLLQSCRPPLVDRYGSGHILSLSYCISHPWRGNWSFNCIANRKSVWNWSPSRRLHIWGLCCAPSSTQSIFERDGGGKLTWILHESFPHPSCRFRPLKNLTLDSYLRVI